ncbi:unnamed protein product [Durusdinium trenchii]|uniref:Uncharacterized protein n=1 Tax=Durusdinium trenchii TaxID=1381693 RepID=A0ABP0LAM7_9DINO
MNFPKSEGNEGELKKEEQEDEKVKLEDSEGTPGRATSRAQPKLLRRVIVKTAKEAAFEKKLLENTARFQRGMAFHLNWMLKKLKEEELELRKKAMRKKTETAKSLKTPRPPKAANGPKATETGTEGVRTPSTSNPSGPSGPSKCFPVFDPSTPPMRSAQREPDPLAHFASPMSPLELSDAETIHSSTVKEPYSSSHSFDEVVSWSASTTRSGRWTRWARQDGEDFEDYEELT